MSRYGARVGSAFALISSLHCGGATSAAAPVDAPSSDAAGASETPDTATVTTDETGSDTAGVCTLTEDTSVASTGPNGCALLVRDTSACRAARVAQGISGFWLKMSCRVTLTLSGGQVQATSDGRPDYESNYFFDDSVCHEVYTGAIQNPNHIATETYSVAFAAAATTTGAPMRGTALVGLALNGVPIYGNFAAPGDDIYQEAKTFDRCGGHPQGDGKYHYHSEPYSITYDDDNFVGVMRDGYPIYGRRDPDGSTPTLDGDGGHTGPTVDDSTGSAYHYHVNQQTSTAPTSAGETQWFLTTGTFHGTPAACSDCN